MEQMRARFRAEHERDLTELAKKHRLFHLPSEDQFG